MRNAAEAEKKRARDTARDKGERNVRVFQRHRRRASRRYAAREMNGWEWRGWKEVVRIITDCLLFSPLCFYALLALGAPFIRPCYGLSFGVELARFLPFIPSLSFGMLTNWTPRRDSTEITNARWMLFSMMKEGTGSHETWGFATTTWVMLLIKICFDKEEDRRIYIKNVCGTFVVAGRIYIPPSRNLKINNIYRNTKNMIENLWSHPVKRNSLK